jgi:plasmid maintenance system antidote protein VapI
MLSAVFVNPDHMTFIRLRDFLTSPTSERLQTVLSQTHYMQTYRTFMVRNIKTVDATTNPEISGPIQTIRTWMLHLKASNGQHLFHNVMPAIDGNVEVMVHKDNESEAKSWLAGSDNHIASRLSPASYPTVFEDSTRIGTQAEHHLQWAAPGIPKYINLYPLPIPSKTAEAITPTSTGASSTNRQNNTSTAYTAPNAWKPRQTKVQTSAITDDQSTTTTLANTAASTRANAMEKTVAKLQATTYTHTETLDQQHKRIIDIEDNTVAKLQKTCTMHAEILERQHQRILEMEEIQRRMNDVTSINEQIDHLSNEVSELREANIANLREIETGHQTTAAIAKAVHQHQATLTQVVNEQHSFKNSTTADLAVLFQTAKDNHNNLQSLNTANRRQSHYTIEPANTHNTPPITNINPLHNDRTTDNHNAHSQRGESLQPQHNEFGQNNATYTNTTSHIHSNDNTLTVKPPHHELTSDTTDGPNDTNHIPTRQDDDAQQLNDVNLFPNWQEGDLELQCTNPKPSKRCTKRPYIPRRSRISPIDRVINEFVANDDQTVTHTRSGQRYSKAPINKRTKSKYTTRGLSSRSKPHKEPQPTDHMEGEYESSEEEIIFTKMTTASKPTLDQSSPGFVHQDTVSLCLDNNSNHSTGAALEDSINNIQHHDDSSVVSDTISASASIITQPDASTFTLSPLVTAETPLATASQNPNPATGRSLDTTEETADDS